MDSFQILEKLISYKTISINSNLELISFCKKLLENIGAKTKIISNSENTKSNLFATIGPENTPGIMLSGHTDVVPIEGQEWKYPASTLWKSSEGGLLWLKSSFPQHCMLRLLCNTQV